MIGILLAGAAAIAGFLLLTGSPARRRLRELVGRGAHSESRARGTGSADVGGGARGAGARPGAAASAVDGTSAGAADADPHRAIAVIDRAAALLRIGLPPATVTIQLAEVSDADLAAVLTRVSRSMSLGDAPDVAFARHAGALPGPLEQVLTGMGSVWAVAESAGAPAAGVLERYAQSRREIAEAERERAVALAGPQATVTVLTWLPVAGLGLALLIGADPLALLGSPVGLVSIGSGVVLLALGRLWMRRMLEGAR
jgi:tight adherence protein B